MDRKFVWTLCSETKPVLDIYVCISQMNPMLPVFTDLFLLFLWPAPRSSKNPVNSKVKYINNCGYVDYERILI